MCKPWRFDFPQASFAKVHKTGRKSNRCDQLAAAVLSDYKKAKSHCSGLAEGVHYSWRRGSESFYEQYQIPV